MNIKKNLGKQIKKFRKLRGFSQEKLAEIIGITQNSLSNIETGENFLTSETLEKLLFTLEISSKDLFDFEHMKPDRELLSEINSVLAKNPDKIQEFYRLLKAIMH